MPFIAKLQGQYGYGTPEGRNNIKMINGFYNQYEYTLEAQAGIIGNIVAESGLNPWRWENTVVDMTKGYGLFQYTPASGYIEDCTDLLGYGPSLSVTTLTPSATPNDGWAQLLAMNDDVLGKWTPTCWRSYWDETEYQDFRQIVNRILQTWGNGTRLTRTQFKSITSIEDAAIAFMCCFEGPGVPNWELRVRNAQGVYNFLSTETKPEPPGSSTLKIWMYLRSFF